MTDRVCRWGILGAAQIAHKNWKAIRNAADCDLVAVASRDLQRARPFIAECQADSPPARAPRAVGSYGELLADPSTDAAERAGRASPEPIPTEVSGELFYPDGISARFYCSFFTGLQQWANASGTRGYLHVRDFALPFFGPELSFEVSNLVFNVRCCDFNMEDHTRRFAVAEYGNVTDSSQETRMFEAFARLALSGQPDRTWGEISRNPQRVLDACLRSARAGGVQVSLNP